MTEQENFIPLAHLQKKLAGILAVNRPGDIADFEAKYIIRELTGISPGELELGGEQYTEPGIANTAIAAAERRLHFEPLQYIFGRAYFMNLELFVSPDVLIPRPETELMVEWLVKNAPSNAVMLDVGCGSGAIPLAMADMRPDLRITGVDISEAALNVARYNREKCNFPQVELLKSDLFSGVSGRKFDIISANLPYVSEDELRICPEEVREFEPHLALIAAEDGLELIRLAIETAGQFLNPGGLIAMEIGETQGARAMELLRDNHFESAELHYDYNRRPRWVSGIWRGKADYFKNW